MIVETETDDTRRVVKHGDFTFYLFLDIQKQPKFEFDDERRSMAFDAPTLLSISSILFTRFSALFIRHRIPFLFLFLEF
ncbi:unnamed protein product [Camellia sinensis]